MDPITQQTVIAAAGAGGGDPVYVDDVFSTFLYQGNGASQTITNGIDLSGEGGMVWIKSTNQTYTHHLQDTERGPTNWLNSASTTGSATDGNKVTAFNSDGFSIGSSADINDVQYSSKYASWSFRKTPGFFDVVTYTGTGSATTIAHNLGSAPGFLIVKRLDNVSTWRCWHRGLPSAENVIHLNESGAYETNSAIWNSTAPTSTHFSVGTNSNVNGNGNTYVAYLFAHDDASFGTDGDESIIKCGSYTGNGSSQEINLGFEPQFIILKVSSGDTGNWYQYDTMRGWTVNSDNQNHLLLNTSAAEGNVSLSGLLNLSVTSTGFKLNNADHNKSLKEYIYIAIRRPHKPPEAGTDVFGIDKLSGSQSYPAFRPGIVTDMGWARRLASGAYYGNGVGVWSRLTGDKFMGTGSTAAEGNDSFGGDNMVGFYSIAISGDIGYSFKRAPGFFDVVAYSGNGSQDRQINHALGSSAPGMVIVKSRTNTQSWAVWHEGGDYDSSEHRHGFLNNTSEFNNYGYFNNAVNQSTYFTKSIFTVRTDLNTNGQDYIAYLFATLPGISKVGSYTGTGNAINVDCGFSSGARFILIKRTDDFGDWYVYDSARGIVSGNDPYFFLNNSGAEVAATDYIDPLSSGFTVTSSAPSDLNTSGGSYIFLAIA